jgi:AraC family transcriptional regulator of adaptative response / DNA-3-methyladenine glycosylase II
MSVRATLDFLGAHAVGGLERYVDGEYVRTVDAPHGAALVAVSPGSDAVRCRLHLQDARDLVLVVSRVRRLLDLDADPVAVDSALATDAALAPLVAHRRGLRSPGAIDGYETAVRTVVGQQISLAAARSVLAKIVAEHGDEAFDGLRLFPRPEVLAAAEPEALPMPRARGRSVLALAASCASGELVLDPGADRDEAAARLLALPGIGRWTVDYVRMRALADPDVLLATDLAARRSATTLGLDLADGRPGWAPWRSVATHHLWSFLYADRWAARRPDDPKDEPCDTP